MSARHDHVLVRLDTACDETRRRCADVLYGVGGPDLAEHLLARYPGCLLVSVRGPEGRCVTLSSTGLRIVATGVTGDREHALLASALHDWLVDVSACRARAAGSRAAGHPWG